MVLKEYRICMPMTVAEYQRGQLYMISRHSDEQSDDGEGVEVVKNEPCHDDKHGDGQYTEKRIHLNKRLPSWAVSFFPTIYVTEKAWNFYPYTITEYECPWLERLQIHIETRYEDNNGASNNTRACQMQTKVQESEFQQREVIHIDIAYDNYPQKHYKKAEDCTIFKSIKTNRGPLQKNWKETQKPIMCCYKLVHVKFEVWGMQTKVENYIHKAVRDILLVGHRQAFAWIDVWYDMTFENIRDYESQTQNATNEKVRKNNANIPKSSSSCSDIGQSREELSAASSKPRNNSTPQ